MIDSSPTKDALKKIGRRLALIWFYGLVVLFTLGAAAQITVQVYAADAPWDQGCSQGLRQLARSLEEARRASERGDLPPEEALHRFRGTLAPVWSAQHSIRNACKATKDPRMQDTFELIERLRYAEENALRREGHGLVPLQRRVQTLLEGLPP